MSRILYYSSCSIAVPHIGIIIDDILSAKKRGDEIYWCYCCGAISSCFMNRDGYPSICHFCHSIYQRFVKKYGDKVNVIPINKEEFAPNSKIPDWPLENVAQINSVIYRDVYIGTSILSFYYMVTRDLDVKNIQTFKLCIKPLISEICHFVDYAYDLIEEIRPDEIISFNGRLYENRLFYDIANALGISYTALDVVGGHVEPYKKVRYEGGLPHDIGLNTKLIENLWKTSPLSDEKKTEIASSFYQRRRNGELVADVAVYTTAQRQGLLPENFDSNKRNVVIFNSSRDETAALGGEWVKGKLFSSDYDALEYMLQNTSRQIHYYLRIHPNLKGVGHHDHMMLYALSKYENLTIIPPESEVSTYSLMDACEKIITFGSTTGVEATFWGKPSILLGRSLYENLDTCYKPASKEELTSLIEKPLKPKSKTGAFKIAYFLLDREFRVDKTNIDIDVKYRKWRWHYRFASYLKIGGSQLLYQIAYTYHYIFLRKFEKGKMSFPKL